MAKPGKCILITLIVFHLNSTILVINLNLLHLLFFFQTSSDLILNCSSEFNKPNGFKKNFGSDRGGRQGDRGGFKHKGGDFKGGNRGGKQGDRSFGDRSFGGNKGGDRSFGNKGGDRSFGKGDGDRGFGGGRGRGRGGGRPPFGGRGGGGRPQGGKFGGKPGGAPNR